jgi:hypothetical protein
MRRVAARAALVGLVAAALGAGGAGPVTAQAAPVVVTTPAEWEAAFLDGSAEAVALGADLALDCSQAQRTATTPVTVDGRDHTITFDCQGAEPDMASGGPLTVEDVTLVGLGGSRVLEGELHLRRVHVEAEDVFTAVVVGAGSTLADVTIDLGPSAPTGLTFSFADGAVVERTTVTGTGSGLSVGGDVPTPPVVRDSTIDVTRYGMALDDDVTVERSSVRAGIVGIQSGGTGTLVVRDSTVVLDGARRDLGSPTHAVNISAIAPVAAVLDQVTLVVVDEEGVVPRTALEAAGPEVTLDLHASVIQARGPDCNLNLGVASGGDNVTNDDTCALDGPSDRILSDVGLEPYDPAAGVARPRRGGPLVDAVTTCTSTADQRGVARPQGPRCDVGAVELEPLAGPVPPVTGSVPPGGGGTAPPATPIPGPARFTG